MHLGQARGRAEAAGPLSEGSLRQGQSWTGPGAKLNVPRPLPCSQCPVLGQKSRTWSGRFRGGELGVGGAAGALELGVWARSAGGDTGLEGRSGELRFPTARPLGQGRVGHGTRRSLRRRGAGSRGGRGRAAQGWREAPGAGPTWPAAPGRWPSVRSRLHSHEALPAPAAARKRGPPPARPVPARPALPVASGSACPEPPLPSAAASKPRTAAGPLQSAMGCSVPSPRCRARAHLPSRVSPWLHGQRSRKHRAVPARPGGHLPPAHSPGQLPTCSARAKS